MKEYEGNNDIALRLNVLRWTSRYALTAIEGHPFKRC